MSIKPLHFFFFSFFIFFGNTTYKTDND